MNTAKIVNVDNEPAIEFSAEFIESLGWLPNDIIKFVIKKGKVADSDIEEDIVVMINETWEERQRANGKSEE